MCNEVLVAQTVVDALGHNFNEGTCDVCGAEDPDYVEPHVHTYDTVVTEPTCTIAGHTTYTCSCGYTYIDNETSATGHTAGSVVVENNVAPDCVNNGSYDNVVYCTVCDAELSRETVTVDALGHDYDAVVTAPDCVNGGYTTYTCTVCNHSYVAD